MAEALTDAAVVYGAQRYFDQVHSDPLWPYRENYLLEGDRLLFFEFLHNLLLYEHLYLDNSSLENDDIGPDLKNFIRFVNSTLGFDWIKVQNVGADAEVNAHSSISHFCALLKEISARDPNLGQRISTTHIPWAYLDPHHHNHDVFSQSFHVYRLPIAYAPFAMYCWRALTYGAMANFRQKQSDAQFAYVAAPGRLMALQSILNRDDIRRYSLPRELLRLLRLSIPQFPSGGFDFTFLGSIPFHATSPITSALSGVSPKAALEKVCSERDSPEVRRIRDDWNDILFSATKYAAVGGVHIQIMKDITTTGDVIQNQIIKSTPNELEDVFVSEEAHFYVDDRY
jgi:hypothetical protein